MHPAYLALSLAALALAAPAPAQNYYLQLEGAPGDAAIKERPGWIVIEAFSKSVARANPGSRAEFSAIEFSKEADSASPRLAEFCATGRRIKRGALDLLSVGAGKPVTLLQLGLADVLVTSFSQFGYVDSQPREQFGLDYTVVEWIYTRIDADGQPVEEVKAKFGRDLGGGGAEIDSDGDGLPNEYEIRFGLNPETNDAAGDLDGDGASNFAEFRAGTAPNTKDSVFQVRGRKVGPTRVELTFTPVAGHTYILKAAATPEGPYTEVGPVDPALNGRLGLETTRLWQFYIVEVR